jgi:hypothetical protein
VCEGPRGARVRGLRARAGAVTAEGSSPPQGRSTGATRARLGAALPVEAQTTVAFFQSEGRGLR